MWASHPTTRCRKAKFCKSVVREHSVGVDAYIGPKSEEIFTQSFTSYKTVRFESRFVRQFYGDTFLFFDILTSEN